MKKLFREVKRVLRREPKITAGDLTKEQIKELVGKDDPTILEVGANDGSHTLWFLELFPNASIHCFEPDPRARKTFRSKIHDDRVRLYELAISDSDGTIDFYASNGIPSEEYQDEYPDGWDASGSIRKPKKHLDYCPWCTFDEKFTVPTMRLDTWCSQQGVTEIDFIWADIQGAEVDLIKGGMQSLANTRYFYTEYSNKELYEGQVNLKSMLKMLPQFELVHRYTYDALLKNKTLASASTLKAA